MRRIFPKQAPVVVDLSDDKTKYLIGWPGYRNAGNKSGLGYVETQAEWAHMRGRIFSMLLTRKVITRNPIFLIGMFVVGAIYSLPLILGLPDVLNGSDFGFYVLFIMSPSWIFGLLILRNVFISVFGRQDEDDHED